MHVDCTNYAHGLSEGTAPFILMAASLTIMSLHESSLWPMLTENTELQERIIDFHPNGRLSRHIEDNNSLMDATRLTRI